MPQHLPPSIIGQTGAVPRVEIELPPQDEQDLPRPHSIPEMPEPNSTTGRFRPITELIAEGDDKAKGADDSVFGSADPAVAAR